MYVQPPLFQFLIFYREVGTGGLAVHAYSVCKGDNGNGCSFLFHKKVLGIKLRPLGLVSKPLYLLSQLEAPWFWYLIYSLGWYQTLHLPASFSTVLRLPGLDTILIASG